MGLRDFHLAGEERRIRTGQLVPKMYSKVHRSRVRAALIFGNIPATALRLPPTVLLCLAGLAIELHPGPGAGNGEVHVELTAALDWPIDAELDFRNPAPVVVVLFVNVKRESGNLDRVL